jgi:hypothetical protein
LIEDAKFAEARAESDELLEQLQAVRGRQPALKEAALFEALREAATALNAALEPVLREQGRAYMLAWDALNAHLGEQGVGRFDSDRFMVPLPMWAKVPRLQEQIQAVVGCFGAVASEAGVRKLLEGKD